MVIYKKTWRRVRTASIWVVVNLSLLVLQPIVNLDISLVGKFLDRSTWIAGLLITGLSGTNAIIAYIDKKKIE